MVMMIPNQAGSMISGPVNTQGVIGTPQQNIPPQLQQQAPEVPAIEAKKKKCEEEPEESEETESSDGKDEQPAKKKSTKTSKDDGASKGDKIGSGTIDK